MKTSRKEYNGKTLSVVVSALAAVLMLFFAGCTMGNGGGSGSKEDTDQLSEQVSGVDYKNYSASDYVVKVKNNTSKKLVVFKGEPSVDTLMGGVPANATNHGLKKNSSMFSNCTSLTTITCMATDISANDCVDVWLYKVSESGTFTKSADMNNWPTGDSGIPTGWTVIEQ